MSLADYYQESYPPSLWGGGGTPSTVTLLSPSTAAVGAATFVLTVTGTGFTDSSDIIFDGDPRVTNFISETQLTCSVGSPVAPARTAQVTVSTGGSAPFTITAAQVQEESEPEPSQEPSE